MWLCSQKTHIYDARTDQLRNCLEPGAEFGAMSPSHFILAALLPVAVPSGKLRLMISERRLRPAAFDFSNEFIRRPVSGPLGALV